MPAAIEMKSLPLPAVFLLAFVSSAASSAITLSIVCGLTATSTVADSRSTSVLSSVVATLSMRASLRRRSGATSDTIISAGLKTLCWIRPWARASAMLPPPMNPSFFIFSVTNVHRRLRDRFARWSRLPRSRLRSRRSCPWRVRLAHSRIVSQDDRAAHAVVRSRGGGRRNRHQAADFYFAARSVEDRCYRIRRDAGLARLAAEIHFDQRVHARRALSSGECLGETDRIDAMDDRKSARGCFGLVGLEMADQMPSNFGQVGQLSALCDCLLHVVLAEIARARLIRGANRLARLRLAREHEPNRRRVATGLVCSCADPRLHDRQPLFECTVNRHLTKRA